jgi:hypothetical protein
VGFAASAAGAAPGPEGAAAAVPVAGPEGFVAQPDTTKAAAAASKERAPTRGHAAARESDRFMG